MATVVQKYGGSSVGSVEKIQRVADRIARRVRSGDRVVAVVSAMGDTTDDLIELAQQISTRPPAREMDLLMHTGEIVSAALMTMALHELGLEAVSLTGQQAGIRTDSVFRRARIAGIDATRMEQELDAGRVVIVAGFQGVSEDLEVTTFGRGGSDTTAVALAAALGSDRCEIYTDVAGVFSADPRIVPSARPLRDIGYEEMLELATTGAVVMHPRAVEVGALYNVEILVASTFDEAAPGTIIHKETSMEQSNKVRGIAHQNQVGKITVRSVPDRPGIAAALFEPLAQANVSVDTIVQNASLEGLTDMTFTVASGDLTQAIEVVQGTLASLGATDMVTDSELGTVSVVGTGMASAPGYAALMFRTLTDHGINIELISTSDIRITCLVKREQVAEAVRALHAAYELDSE